MTVEMHIDILGFVFHAELGGLIYDVAIALITGALVWFVTDRYMRNRDERQQFELEIQTVSRYLAELKVMVDCLAKIAAQSTYHQEKFEYLSWMILRRIETAPLHRSFKGKSINGFSEILNEISEIETELKELLEKNEITDESLKRVAGKLYKCRHSLVVVGGVNESY